jgi:hypothetical protein
MRVPSSTNGLFTYMQKAWEACSCSTCLPRRDAAYTQRPVRESLKSARSARDRNCLFKTSSQWWSTAASKGTTSIVTRCRLVTPSASATAFSRERDCSFFSRAAEMHAAVNLWSSSAAGEFAFMDSARVKGGGGRIDGTTATCASMNDIQKHNLSLNLWPGRSAGDICSTSFSFTPCAGMNSSKIKLAT